MLGLRELGYAYAIIGGVVHTQTGFSVGAGAVWLVLWLARRMGVVGPARETPLDILKARYARGEISEEQFKEMARTLQDV